MVNIENARLERLNEFKNVGVDGFIFACQSLIEKNENVNFIYVDINTVIENAETLFTFNKTLNGLYFRKSKSVDKLLNNPNLSIGKKIKTVSTIDFENKFADFKEKTGGKVNKGGFCEILIFNKTVDEILTDKKLIDGQITVDGQIKNVQMKSSLIAWKNGKNNGCSNAELIKFKKGD